MRTLAKTAVALGFIGTAVFGTTAAVQAQGVYFGFGHPHPYYRDYDDYHYGHGPRYYGYRSPCRPGWTVQGGVCRPYRYGPWDRY